MNVGLLQVTGPIYLLIGLGYVAARRGWISSDHGRVLGRFVAQFCVPALVLRTLSHLTPEQILQADFLLPYAFGSLLAMGIVLAVSTLALGRPMSLAAIQSLGASSSNSVFIGYPVLHQLIGAPAAVALALVQIVENALMIPLGLTLAESRSGRSLARATRATLVSVARNPLIMAVAIGLVLSAGSVQVPAPIDTVLGLMAAAAPPTALIVIGVSLAGLKLGGMKLDLGLVAGAKLLLHPLCVALMLMLWQPSLPAMGVAALLYAAMPMMSIYPVLGQRHHHESFCAGALLAATVASFVTVNVLVALAPAFPSMW